MRKAGWVRIVDLASTAGLAVYGHAVVYTASKHALAGMTRALALELARTVGWLVEPDTRSITGQAITIAGEEVT